MTRITMLQPKTARTLAALLTLALSSGAAFAATVTVRNEGPTPVQVGFGNAPPTAVAPRGVTRVTLNAGEHPVQCRFEGNYDGCNLGDRITVGENDLEIRLRPVFTLERAVDLVRQGVLRVETRRDLVWGTTALAVEGEPSDCLDYEAGRLAAVSRRVATRARLRDVTLATQNLCGEERPVVGAVVGNAQLYFHPRFLVFTEALGRPVLVRP